MAMPDFYGELCGMLTFEERKSADDVWQQINAEKKMRLAEEGIKLPNSKDLDPIGEMIEHAKKIPVSPPKPGETPGGFVPDDGYEGEGGEPWVK